MLIALGLVVACAVPLPPPRAALPTTVVIAPKARLLLETATTPAQRERGLMNRPSLPPHTGMLFVFDADGPVSFWMKETLIPLDMIFVAPDGTVRRVFARVPVVAPNTPDDAIPLESGSARYVIELTAGEAAQDGIVSGTRLHFARTP
ncbi:MAG TPA: DUF192 domain-containing protein [Candidatus Tyrphobacter sp.]